MNLLLRILLIFAFFGIRNSYCDEVDREGHIEGNGVPEIKLVAVRSDSVKLTWTNTGVWEGASEFGIEIITVSPELEKYNCHATVECSESSTCVFDSKTICSDFPSCTEIKITVSAKGTSSNKHATTAPPGPTNVTLQETFYNVICSWEIPQDFGDSSCTENIHVEVITLGSTYIESLSNVSLRSWKQSVTGCDEGEVRCSVQLLGGSEGASSTEEGSVHLTAKGAGTLIGTTIIQPHQDSLHISWEIKSECKRITGYLMSWTDDDGRIKGQQELQSRTYTIDNLLPCVLYDFEIQPLRDGDRNLGSPFKGGIGTLTKAPDKPTQLTCSTMSLSESRVSWQPPIIDTCVEEYVLKYSGDILWSDDTDSNRILVEKRYLSRTLRNLTAYTRYEICVAGFKYVDNPGEFACCITQTPEAVPGKPSSFMADPYANSIVLSWKAPREKNGIITGYRLFQEGGEQKNFSGNMTSTVINGLSSATTYKFTLQAETSVGFGSDIGISVTTTNVLAITLGVVIPVVVIAAVVATIWFLRKRKR